MTMPAGTYYVGDLCYVMHDEWDEFCTLTISDHHVVDGEFNLKDGRRFAFRGTEYGDGVYNDNYGHQYGVDAGLIGCILVSDITIQKGESSDDLLRRLRPLGAIVEFDKPFKVPEVIDGVIRIGHLAIPTGDDEDEDEDNDPCNWFGEDKE